MMNVNDYTNPVIMSMILEFQFAAFSSIMQGVTFLLICFSGVVDSLMIRNAGKVRNLFFSNMVDRFDNDFNPTNFIGLLRCGQLAGHLECLMACSRDQRCTAVNYIPDARICLLSSSDYQVRPMEDPGAAFFKSTLYTVPLDGMSEVSVKRVFFTKTVKTEQAHFTLMKVEDSHGCKGNRSHRYSDKISHGKAPHGCGTTGQNLHPFLVRNERIINGYTPLPYNMPWMGTLTKDRRSICSAILLSKSPRDKSSGWAIVASHCIYKEADEKALDEKEVDYSRFGLLFGVHDLRLATPHIRYRKILKVHRNFEPSDISLVKLNKAVKFDLYINGICFPDEPEEKDVAEFSNCITCGWGATKPSTPTTVSKASDELQCIVVEVEQEKPNHIRRKSLLTIRWHDVNLQGPYKGDSGSPLFCRLIYDPKKFLHGIVTSGASFTLSGLTNFERIPSNLEWINQVMDRIPDSTVILGQQKCCFSFKFHS